MEGRNMEYKMTVPDNDAKGWIETLRQGGFSQGEIDAIMSHLNKTYRDVIDPVENRIEEELTRTEEHLRKTYGSQLTQEQRTYLRKAIAERDEFKK